MLNYVSLHVKLCHLKDLWCYGSEQAPFENGHFFQGKPGGGCCFCCQPCARLFVVIIYHSQFVSGGRVVGNDEYWCRVKFLSSS